MGQSKAYAADANQGKEMYMQYCSSCHGPDGKGSGSVKRFPESQSARLNPSQKEQQRGLSGGSGHLSDSWAPQAPIPWRSQDAGVGESFSSEVKDAKTTEVTISLKEKAIAEYVATLQR